MGRLIERNPWVLIGDDYQARPDAHLAGMFANAARAYVHAHALDGADEALLLDALGLDEREVTG